MSYCKDYVNIDLLREKSKALILISSISDINESERVLNPGEVIYSSEDGVVLITDKFPEEKKEEKNEDNIIKFKNRTPQKVFKSYKVNVGDTLNSIVSNAFKEYPNLAKYYTLSQLLNEIKSLNILIDGDVQKRSHINIPYFVEPTYDIDLDDYEDYYVRIGMQNFISIVLDRGYTKDYDEIMELVKEMKQINGIDNPVVGTTIKIPNVEKYLMSKNTSSMAIAR